MATRLDSLEENFLNTIKDNNLIEKGDKIVVGVSGGPDSITLLYCLNKYKEKLGYEIVVAHINHLIRKDSTEDEQFVENVCKEMKIKCYIKRADIIKMAEIEKRGEEETGRMVRYAFFDEIAQKESANKIAIAHNMNDKVETVLMNIIRGAGSLGLKGIEPKRDNKYIRPLIETERKDIEEYCNINKLEPKFDESNNDNTYTRNKVRNILIPFIKKEFNPNIIKGINNLSEIVTEEQNYLEKIVNNIYSQIKIEETKEKVILDLKEFNKQDTIIKKRILLLSISRIFGTSKNIERIHIEDIIKLCERNIGNKYLTPNKNVKVFVNKGKIIISHTY